MASAAYSDPKESSPSKVMEPTGTNMPQPANKKQCPVKSCRQFVSSACFARHLKRVHNYSAEKCKYASNRFNVRKKYTWKSDHQAPKKSDFHLIKRCPIPGCFSVNKRMNVHLTNVHKLLKSSEEYKMYIQRAVPCKKASKQEQRAPMPTLESIVAGGTECLTEGGIIKSDGEDSSYNGDEVESVSSSVSCLSAESREEETPADNQLSIEHPVDIMVDAPLSDRVINNAEGSASEDGVSESELANEICELTDEQKSMEHLASTLLQQFYRYLISADKDKDPKAAMQCKVQVEKVLDVVSSSSNDLNCLFEKNLVRYLFLRIYVVQKKLQPKTVKAYLTSLQHFYSFIIAEELTGFCTERVNAMSTKVKDWQRVYQKRFNNLQFEKMEKKVKTQILPRDIQNFEHHPVTRRIFSSLEDFVNGQGCAVTQKTYTNCRNFILAQILIETAHRSGVLANFTIGQYKGARFVPDERKYIMKITDHKTKGTHGSANLIVTMRLFEWIQVYVDKFRPVVESNCSNNDKVFVTWNGNGMTSGMISEAINSLFQSTGFQHRVSATKFRQTAATQVREKDKTLSAATADLMCHQEKTAEVNYVLREKERQSFVAASALPLIMRGVYSPDGEEGTEGIEADGLKSNLALKLVATKDEVRERRKMLIEESSCTATSPKSRQNWTEAEKAHVEILFAEEIRSKFVSREQVEQKIKDDIVLGKFSWKQVLDKVRSLWRWTATQSSLPALAHESLPVESFQDKVERMYSEPSCSSTHTNSNVSGSVKDIFSPSHVELIKSFCLPIILSGPISIARIKQTLETSEGSDEILGNYSLTQIQNRLKYERRKRK